MRRGEVRHSSLPYTETGCDKIGEFDAGALIGVGYGVWKKGAGGGEEDGSRHCAQDEEGSRVVEGVVEERRFGGVDKMENIGGGGRAAGL